jgi:hypothetical protein
LVFAGFCKVNKFLVDSPIVSFCCFCYWWRDEIGKRNKFSGDFLKNLKKWKISFWKEDKKSWLLLMEDINQLMPGDRRPPQLSIKE